MESSHAVISFPVDREADTQDTHELVKTPSKNSIPVRHGDFETLADALDYAAKGRTGYNFYSRRGKLYSVISYSRLRHDARVLARKLLYLRVPRGSRVAIVANTHPEFVRFFFACQYAGLVPVPLPIVMHLNGAQAYIRQIARLLDISKARIAVATHEFFGYLEKASQECSHDIEFLGKPEDFYGLPESSVQLSPLQKDELAYLQFTSGSTRFPKGVMITQEAVLSNLQAITRHGIECRNGDRAVSWLPFYHDMGLVGLVLSTMASQLSVDYFGTSDFAMRPGLWLKLMAENRATISFSPPFGYELAALRLRSSDIESLDLSAWRVAGVGAEMIRPELLERFASRLEPCGFDSGAFLPCYGMAECSLAVTFAVRGKGIQVDSVDAERLASHGEIVPVENGSRLSNGRVKTFVKCGRPLPGFQVEIRDSFGNRVPAGKCGILYLKGPSVMSGYLGDKDATSEVLSEDGWLNTGDTAYMSGSDIVITGRSKDLIIINGRNIWPQDLEYLAETLEEVRIGDACAFSITGEDGKERAVLVIQYKNGDREAKEALTGTMRGLVLKELGIDCMVKVVPRNTLVRTTSGKPSRSATKKACIEMGLL